MAFDYGEVTQESPSLTLTVHSGDQEESTETSDQPGAPAEPEEKPAPAVIYQISTAQVEAESGAVTDSFRLFGSKMTDDIQVKAYLDGQAVNDVTIASIEGDKGGSRTITLQAPVNTSGQDKVYTVAFDYGLVTEESPSLTLTVHSGDQEESSETSDQPEAPISDAEIIAIRPTELIAESGAVTDSFRLLGSKMTDDIQIKAYLDGQVVNDVTIASIEGDKGGSRMITLQAPVNTTDQDQVYTVYFGYGEVTTDSPSITLTVHPSQEEGDPTDLPSQPEDQPSSQAEIRMISVDELAVESGTPSEPFKLFGVKLTDAVNVKAYLNGQETNDVTIASIAGDKGGSRELTLQAPVNTTDQDQVYTVYFGYGEVTTDSPSITLTVHPSQEEGDPTDLPSQPEDQPSSQAEIRMISVDELAVESGTPSEPFKLFGVKLTDAVNVKAYLNGQETNDVTIASIAGDKGGSRELTLQAPVNTTDQDQVYTVYFGYGEVTTDSPSITLTVHPGQDEEDQADNPNLPGDDKPSEDDPQVTPPNKNPEDTIETNLEVGLDQPIANLSKTRKAINLKFKEAITTIQKEQLLNQITYSTSENTNPQSLPEGSNTILLGDTFGIFLPQELTEDITLHIPKGLFVGQDSQTTNDDWQIPVTLQEVKETKITGYSFDQDVLPNTGGRVNITISGENLVNPNEDPSNGTRIRIFDPSGLKVAQEIMDQVTYTGGDDRLVASVPLPANHSDQSQSYRLTFYHQGNKIYQRYLDTNRGDRPAFTVLAKDQASDQPTISYMTIASYAPSGTGSLNDQLDLTHTTVALNQRSKKTEVRIYGANLDETIMDAYAVDQYGVKWPIVAGQLSQYPKRVLTGNSGIPNGFVGGGNFMIAEIILPSDYDEDLTFTYYFAPDGKNYDEVHTVSATVEVDDGRVTLEKKTVTVEYREKETDKVIKDPTQIVGYTFFDNPIKNEELEIDGYQLETDPASLLEDSLGDLPDHLVLYYRPLADNSDEQETNDGDKPEDESSKSEAPAIVYPKETHPIFKTVGDNLTEEEVTNAIVVLGLDRSKYTVTINEDQTLPSTDQASDAIIDVTINFEDGTTDDAQVVIIITEPADTTAPVIDAANVKAVEGQQIPPVMVDVDDLDATVTVDGLPEGLTYNPETKQIEGTIAKTEDWADDEEEKSLPAIISVTEAGGIIATKDITVTVLRDTDGDGTPDTTDNDDDNDGVDDQIEKSEGTDSKNANETPLVLIEEIEESEITNGDQTVKEDEAIEDIVITPGEGSTVTVGELPDGLTHDEETGTISGTPTVDDWTDDEEERELTFDIDTENEDGSGSTETVTITVQRDTDGDGTPDVTDTDDDNDGVSDEDEKKAGTDPKDADSKPIEDTDTTAPVIDVASVIAVEGQPIPPVLVDVDDLDAKVTVDGLPEGLTYNPETKQIEGTIAKADDWEDAEEVRTQSATITVTDEDGNTSTKDITVTILRDTDGDGTPDTTDSDDDNDGVDDLTEKSEGTDPKDAASKPEIADEDNDNSSENDEDPSDDGKEDPSDDGKEDPSDDGKEDPSDEDSKSSEDDSKPSDDAEEDDQPSLADQTDITLSEKTGVKDINNLTEIEKEKVKIAITDANKLPKGTEVLVGSKGDVIINYPDGSHDVIDGKDLVYQLLDSETGKPADPDKGGTPSEPGTGDADKGSDDASDSKGGDKDSSKDKDSKGGDQGSSKDSKAKDSQDKLPQTGESSSAAILGLAGLSIMAGLGLVAGRRKEDN